MEIEVLSPEILLGIITCLPDLGTLYNLLRASPCPRRLFNHEALTIIQAVHSNADCPLPSQIQELTCAVILARSSALPFHTLDDFILKFLRCNLPHVRHRNLPTFTTLGANSLAPVTPSPAILRSVVATAQHISVLTQACLNSYLARLRDAAFAIQHCYEEGFRYTHGYGPNRKWVPPWDREFVGTAVEVCDTGPPSWIEEMRVMRALWLIQLVGDVQCLATKDDNELGWPREEVKRMSRIEWEDLTEITGLPPFYTGVEEVRTVTDYLGEFEEQRTGRTSANAEEGLYYRLPQPPREASDAAWTTQEPEACIMTWGNVGFMYDYGNKVIQIEPTPEIKEHHPFHGLLKAKIWVRQGTHYSQSHQGRLSLSFSHSVPTIHHSLVSSSTRFADWDLVSGIRKGCTS